MFRKNVFLLALLCVISSNAVFSFWLYSQQSVLLEKISADPEKSKLLLLVKKQNAVIEALQQDAIVMKNRVDNAFSNSMGNGLTKSDVVTMFQDFTPDDAMIKDLQARIVRMEDELTLVAKKEGSDPILLTRQNQGGSVETSPVVRGVEFSEFNPEQMLQQFSLQELEQKQNFEEHLQQMNGYLQTTPDYVGASNLESDFQAALNRKLQENDGLPVSLSSVSCSQELCKVSLSGNMVGEGSEEPDSLLQLLALGVIPESTDFMTVPTEVGMDIYLGQGGQALPQLSE